MEDLKSKIANIKDFPNPGIMYRDISPLLKEYFQQTIDALIEMYSREDLNKVDYIAGVESRGFIFAAPIAYKLNKGLVMIRKSGKLPNPDVSESYNLEYGHASIEMHSGKGGIMIVDDVLATGGTLNASANLAKKGGYDVVTLCALIDLGLLKNYNWHGLKCQSLIQY